jgi:spermidine/putrescine transport system permease protein
VTAALTAATVEAHEGEADGARRRSRFAWVLLAPGLAYLVLFFVAPVAVLLLFSFYERVPGGAVGQTTPAFRIANYTEAIAEYAPQFGRSFLFALIATVLTLAIGYPLAYVIAVRARNRPLLQGLMLVMVIAPFFTSFILRTIAWKQILADESAVVAVLKAVAILPEGARLTATPFAVVAGLTYNFLPFMVLPIYASLERIDTSLIEAGKDLYASARQAFFRVTLPLTTPGVIAGVLLTFIPASGDYVNAAFLGGANNTMIGNKIQSTYLVESDYPKAAALSFLMMAAVLALVFIYIRFAGTEAFTGSEEEAK